MRSVSGKQKLTLILRIGPIYPIVIVVMVFIHPHHLFCEGQRTNAALGYKEEDQ